MATAANRFVPVVPLPGRPIHLDPSADPQRASADAQLAAALQRGEPGALDRVYHRFAGSLLQLATRITGSPESGEDVVHDVFIALPGGVIGYRETGQFDRWLRRLVTRRALDHIRLSVRRNEVDYDVEEESAYSTQQPDIPTRLAIDAAIAALPDPLRAVFVLRAVEGYAHAEIAELLGIQRGTCEVRFFRAVRALRLTLEEHE
jgi:RNA polymerase sigma factor (sigma-70 family)